MTKVPPPISYAAQRKLERTALKTRQAQLEHNSTLPPVCGYTYVPRKPSTNTSFYNPAPTICMRNAGASTTHLGKGYCNYHDWQANHDIGKQPTQVQKAREEAHRQSVFLGLPTATDPHTALMDEVQRSAGMVEWLRQRMAEKAEEYETKKASAEDDEYHAGSDALLVQWTPKAGQQPSAWWVLYQEERKHLINACLAAIKAGVAERRVAIAEQQGQLIVALFFSFIHDTELGLMPEQIMKAPALIRKHMAAMPREGQGEHQALGVINAVAHDS